MEALLSTPTASDLAAIVRSWQLDAQAKLPTDSLSDAGDRKTVIARFTGILIALFGNILVALIRQASIGRGTLISLNRRLLRLLVAPSESVDGLLPVVAKIAEESHDLLHDLDNSSSDTVTFSSSEFNDVEEVAEDLRVDVECLVELGPMLENPAFDPQPSAETFDSMSAAI
ncbi:hypothetical protein B0T22DRAFT_485398 [Podospora appendiculata]|uniref:Uncharacterized protein n=1 Tax=Podospora appendiculata TaxID=314037 RepID=A0AAE0WZ42_9PEZI|nr:hypothetical protein B0T22DRAFT_485398 [Podospora appendiculata]